MHDGSHRWFRGPTFAEAAAFWKIPAAPIAQWWDARDAIFDGAVPTGAPPLVSPSQRAALNASAPPYAPQQQQQQATTAIVTTPPGGGTVYPQAVQPAGPPLHPLYRANFALGEVSKEVAHMLQNQQNLYLENLLRAIALSQALVNDLSEAHRVLLDPQAYPQYYPSSGSPRSRKADEVIPPLPDYPSPSFNTFQRVKTQPRYVPPPEGQQACQSTWLISTPPPGPSQPVGLSDEMRTILKRGFASINDVDGTDGREKRRRDTAGTRDPHEDSAATHSERGGGRRPESPIILEDDEDRNSTQHDGTVPNTDSGRAGAASIASHAGATGSTRKPDSGEPENLEEAASDAESENDEVVLNHNEETEQQYASNDSVAQETGNGAQADPSPDTATEPGSDGDGSLSSDPAVSSTAADGSGANGEAAEGKDMEQEDADTVDISSEDESEESDELSP